MPLLGSGRPLQTASAMHATYTSVEYQAEPLPPHKGIMSQTSSKQQVPGKASSATALLVAIDQQCLLADRCAKHTWGCSLSPTIRAALSAFLSAKGKSSSQTSCNRAGRGA